MKKEISKAKQLLAEMFLRKLGVWSKFKTNTKSAIEEGAYLLCIKGDNYKGLSNEETFKELFYNNNYSFISFFVWTRTKEQYMFWNEVYFKYVELIEKLYLHNKYEIMLELFLRRNRTYSKFVKNCKKDALDSPYTGKFYIKSIFQSKRPFEWGFVWRNTPEGYDYWERLAKDYVTFKEIYYDEIRKISEKGWGI